MKKIRHWLCAALLFIALVFIGLAAKTAPENDLEKSWEELDLF